MSKIRFCDSDSQPFIRVYSLGDRGGLTKPNVPNLTIVNLFLCLAIWGFVSLTIVKGSAELVVYRWAARYSIGICP